MLIKNKKILLVDGQKLLASSGYVVYVSYDSGSNWERLFKIDDKRYAILSRFRMFSRLLRVEITEIIDVADGYVCVAKKALFKCRDNERFAKKVFDVKRGSKPINLTKDQNNVVYFGEYFSNDERDYVYVYSTKDNGITWSVVHRFDRKTIRHVHGLYYDKYENIIWFLTGDADGECIIGYTRDGFATIEKVCMGGQQCRGVKIFFYEDYIIYCTDTPEEKNGIYKIDRKTMRVERVFDVTSSVIHGAQIGNECFISTTVEPSKINKEKRSYLYYSNNGIEWRCVLSEEKDVWSMKYFQFGSIIIPRYKTIDKYFYYYGRALKKIDGHTIVMDTEKMLGRKSDECRF